MIAMLLEMLITIMVAMMLEMLITKMVAMMLEVFVAMMVAMMVVSVMLKIGMISRVILIGKSFFDQIVHVPKLFSLLHWPGRLHICEWYILARIYA